MIYDRKQEVLFRILRRVDFIVSVECNETSKIFFFKVKNWSIFRIEQ
jgi:hypothetical protein